MEGEEESSSDEDDGDEDEDEEEDEGDNLDNGASDSTKWEPVEVEEKSEEKEEDVSEPLNCVCGGC